MLLRDVSVAAVVLLLCVQCLHGSALPAVSSYEFTAYRMQQYNLVQQKHGKFRCSVPILMYIYSNSEFTVSRLFICFILVCSFCGIIPRFHSISERNIVPLTHRDYMTAIVACHSSD